MAQKQVFPPQLVTFYKKLGKKYCQKCGRWLPYSGFNKDKARKDGLHSTCRECQHQVQVAWYAKNTDHVKAQHQAYKQANPGKKRQWQKAWLQTESGKLSRKANKASRRAKERAAWVEYIPARFIKKLHHGKYCLYCGRPFEEWEDRHLDHIIPLEGGGLHTMDNLVECCSICNSKKQDRPLQVLLQENLDIGLHPHSMLLDPLGYPWIQALLIRKVLECRKAVYGV